MIGKFDRHCPKCGAGICRYNADAFCWPCQPPEGFIWHWSTVTHEWIEIPVLKLEPEWQPEPGDILLGRAFTPEPRKRDNWDRCGCGGQTNIAKVTDKRAGVVAGQPRRFLPGHHSRNRHGVSQEELTKRRRHVKRGYQEGKTLREVASQLGLTKMQVHSDVVALRRKGELPPPRRCKALSNSGKRCGAPASADGLCGGHGSEKSGRPPASLPIPVEVLRSRYEAGETIASLAADIGIGTNLLADRLKKSGCKIRPRGCEKGKAPWRYGWLKTEEVVDLWNGGQSMTDLARHFKVSYSCVWYRLVEGLGDASDQQLRRLYIDEELPLGQVAAYLDCSKYQVAQRLGKLGIAFRQGGRPRKRATASAPTIRQIQIAAAQRGREQGSRDLTAKQTDLLNVLRASPVPISSRRVADDCKGLPHTWSGTGTGVITDCLRALEARGLVCSVVSRGAGHYRGRNILVWFPADQRAAVATSAEDAQRLREIQILIEDQEQEEARGQGEVGHGWDRSLDAPLTEDGLTILDTLGDEDEALQELIGEPA